MNEKIVKKHEVRKLDLRKKQDQKIAAQVDAALKATNKYFASDVIKKSSLRKKELRRFFKAIRKAVPSKLLIQVDRLVPVDSDTYGVIGCGAHVDACSMLEEPCTQDSWLPGCDVQADCTSEACSSEFMCAGTHACQQNVCSDNTCHSDVFNCNSYEVGCTADTSPQCTVDEPQCVLDEPQCMLDEPQCVIDEPPTSCPGEDEGSDCFVHLDEDESPSEVVSLFSSKAWEQVILDIAVKGVDLDKRLNNTRITVEEDLFDE